MDAIALAPPSRLKRALAIFGPGLVVMLADTDAGSIITAAQSGAQWGYKLLLLQILLIPVLYIVQELTVRLGTVTGKGHGDLIKHHFGRRWGWLSVGTLLAACLGALLTEMSGLVGVGQMYGIPAWQMLSAAVAGLSLMAYTGSYRSVERIAIALGAFELVFVVVACKARPEGAAMLAGLSSMPLGNHDYLFLVAANIGAVIMPWMVFYQQSAVVEKGLRVHHLRAARWDTAIGAVVTQVIMAMVLIVTAATLASRGHSHAELNTVQQIADAITPFLGEQTGKLLFGMGMIGASLVAAIVVTLTAARALGELMGYRHTLEHSPRQAPWFYATYTLSLLLAALFVGSGASMITIGVGVQVMNALLLPIVLGFLYLLARRLPSPYRLKGAYAWVAASIIGVTVCLGVYSGIAGLFA
ncbi:NRAMP family divalent metal transporter [Paludibacterium purpuratum]|uniref:NRAMP (Natural resistance-associated macrophage protein)-like metal ion transporter n=1 Tax=Paludibacterium purpuratum TaxID=1144873 RepID=A0A4R7B9Q1_9NEIS|nr:divalent metal cation transporter [Paludibacterium purpuratum]TDR81568.1 NRAMP (natural resistance-associated macrophage protein)-like metal ion transporter [Paludibacterium purpuratum]